MFQAPALDVADLLLSLTDSVPMGKVAREKKSSDRDVKRAKKAQAKRSRKASKSHGIEKPDDHKSSEKIKALANDPQKIEKKRQRLLKRSRKLELQGNKLLAEAKKIAEQYKLMTEAQEVCHNNNCMR